MRKHFRPNNNNNEKKRENNNQKRKKGDSDHEKCMKRCYKMVDAPTKQQDPMHGHK